MGGARAGREEQFLGKGRLKRRARQMARPKTRLTGLGGMGGARAGRWGSGLIPKKAGRGLEKSRPREEKLGVGENSGQWGAAMGARIERRA